MVPQQVVGNVQTSTPKYGQPPDLSTPYSAARYSSVTEPLYEGQSPARPASAYDIDRYKGSDVHQEGTSSSPSRLLARTSQSDLVYPQPLRGKTEGGNDMREYYVEPQDDTDMVGNNDALLHSAGQQKNSHTHHNTSSTVVHPYTYNTAPPVFHQDSLLPVPNGTRFTGYRDKQDFHDAGQFQAQLSSTSPAQKLGTTERAHLYSEEQYENYKVQYGKSDPSKDFPADGSSATIPRPTTPGGESEDASKEEFFNHGKTQLSEKLSIPQ